MSENKEFQNMIEIISYALEIQGRAAESFERSARNATTEVARNLFLEIAEEFGKNRDKLLGRKQKLLDALYHLRSVEQKDEDYIESPKFEYHTNQANNTQNISRDPVCDMKVDETDCPYVSVYKGEKYVFCCEDCQKAFELAPPKYVQI